MDNRPQTGTDDTDTDIALDETFPASDPPASGDPAGGITGPNDKPHRPAPQQGPA